MNTICYCCHSNGPTCSCNQQSNPCKICGKCSYCCYCKAEQFLPFVSIPKPTTIVHLPFTPSHIDPFTEELYNPPITAKQFVALLTPPPNPPQSRIVLVGDTWFTLDQIGNILEERPR